MLCIVDKSLSAFMTLRRYLCEFCLFGIFYGFYLNHLIKDVYLFCTNGCLWRDFAFRALNLFFHLQIINVYNNITSPVTRKSTDLVFKFGKIFIISLFNIDL